MFRQCTFLIGLLVISPALLAFSYSPQAIEAQGTALQWFWALLILVAALLLVWWWLRKGAGEDASQSTETDAAIPSFAVQAPAPAEEAAPPAPPVEQATPDDLQRIEGIGPKIFSLLHDAGITTFTQLAESSVDQLKQIVLDAGISIANPDTWPEQAALAAAGKWDELEVLQDELKGGRRV